MRLPAALSSAPASLTIGAQNLAVAFRRDRQAMLEIPGRKAAFAGIVAQFDLAFFQRFAIGRPMIGSSTPPRAR